MATLDDAPRDVTLGEVYRAVLALTKSIEGNGQPGLIQRQTATETDIAALKATQGRVSLGVIFSALGSAAATAAAIAAVIRLGQS